jgi:hypothetical protein
MAKFRKHHARITLSEPCNWGAGNQGNRGTIFSGGCGFDGNSEASASVCRGALDGLEHALLRPIPCLESHPFSKSSSFGS